MRAPTKLLVYLFGLFALCLFACKQDNEKKSVSLDSIRPHSRTQIKHKEPAKTTDTLGPQLNYYANDSAQLGIAQLAIDTTIQTHFLDRFTKKWNRYLLIDSSQQKLSYYSWHFNDSTTCVEALYNWLDQAGKNQQSVMLGRGNIFNEQHSLYIVAKNELLFIQSEKTIAQNKWLKWYEGKADTTPIYYVFTSKPKQKTKWFQYTNAKLSPYEPR